MKDDSGQYHSAFEKLLSVASTIRTPLALAGVVTVILYAIYQQVLGLDVFDNIGSDSTFALLLSIIDKLFYIALLAILLGVVCYLIPFFVRPKSNPPVAKVAPNGKRSSSMVELTVLRDLENNDWHGLINPKAVLDIGVKYHGPGQLFVERIKLFHIDSSCTSAESGAFPPSHRYKIQYKPDSVTEQPLRPPLVITQAMPNVPALWSN